MDGRDGRVSGKSVLCWRLSYYIVCLDRKFFIIDEIVHLYEHSSRSLLLLPQFIRE